MVRPVMGGVVLALALFGGPSARADEPAGYVQFKGEAGIRIELDGRPAGVTAEPDGLIVRGIEPGARRFSAYRDGFVPQFGVVIIDEDAVTVHRLEAWQPLIEVAVSKQRGFGTLVVETLPVHSTIQARRLGWKQKVEKGEGPFIAREIPAGRHKFTFCTEFKCIDYWVRIPAGGVQKLLVDFDPGHIFDVSKELSAEWKDASGRCLRDRDRSACTLACEHDGALRPEVTSPACVALNGGDPTRMVAQTGEAAVQVSASFRAPDECGIEEGSAFLSVSSREPIEVLLGDDSIGQTPLVRRAIPAGCHQLVAITRQGKRHKVSIRVQPNEERRIKLTF